MLVFSRRHAPPASVYTRNGISLRRTEPATVKARRNKRPAWGNAIEMLLTIVPAQASVSGDLLTEEGQQLKAKRTKVTCKQYHPEIDQIDLELDFEGLTGKR